MEETGSGVRNLETSCVFTVVTTETSTCPNVKYTHRTDGDVETLRPYSETLLFVGRNTRRPQV